VTTHVASANSCCLNNISSKRDKINTMPLSH